MAMAQHSVVVGIFATQDQAKQAISDLQSAGYSEQEIGYLARVGVAGNGDDVTPAAATGVIGGGVIGGLLGAAAALLIPGLGPALAGGILAATAGGAAIGATAGGFIATLTGMGVSERDARFYQKELEAGRTIITVKVSTGYEEVENILRRNGATDARAQLSTTNAIPPERPYGSPPETYDPSTGPDGINEQLYPPPDEEEDRTR